MRNECNELQGGSNCDDPLGATVATTSLKAIKEEELARLLSTIELLEAAAQATIGRARLWIASCCGRPGRIGSFCDSYGCSNLKELIEPLQEALFEIEMQLNAEQK